MSKSANYTVISKAAFRQENVRTMVSAFPVWLMQQEILQSDALGTETSVQVRDCMQEAGGRTKFCEFCSRDHIIFVYSTSTLASISVYYVYCSSFLFWICVLFKKKFHLCRVGNIINAPTCSESFALSLADFIHGLIWRFTWRLPRMYRASDSAICVLTYSPSR